MENCILLKGLESYKYEYQYFLEKSKDIENFKNEIEKSYERLNDLKDKNIETNNLNIQIQKIIEKQTKEENSLLKILSKKQEIENRINSLDQPYKNIFFLKYISGNTFDEIAGKMNYSTKRIYQLHKEGVLKYCQKQQNKSVPEISTN